MTAPAPAPVAAPAPATAPAPAAPVAPIAPAPLAVDPNAPAAEPTQEQEQLGRQMNARFSVVRLPDGSKPGTQAAAPPVPEPAAAPAAATPPPTAPVATG